jgi:hypothetical protein
MNAIYKIIGEDGKEYGPVTAEQIRQWAAEGRIEHRTPIFADGAKDWNFVALLPEFANCFAASGMPPPPIAPPAPGNSAAGQMAKTNSYALAGMIFGILSVACCCGFPCGILGVVFSLIGLSQINANPRLHEGRAMAIAGLILSIVSLILGAAWIFFNLAMSQPHVSWNVNGL